MIMMLTWASSRYTKTGFCWPKRYTRNIDWISCDGFHDASKMITLFAVSRLMPRPPAFVEIRNNLSLQDNDKHYICVDDLRQCRNKRQYSDHEMTNQFQNIYICAYFTADKTAVQFSYSEKVSNYAPQSTITTNY